MKHQLEEFDVLRLTELDDQSRQDETDLKDAQLDEASERRWARSEDEGSGDRNASPEQKGAGGGGGGGGGPYTSGSIQLDPAPGAGAVIAQMVLVDRPSTGGSSVGMGSDVASKKAPKKPKPRKRGSGSRSSARVKNR